MPGALDNEFVPVDRDIGECISAIPKPGCGSEARSGWRQAAVFLADPDPADDSDRLVIGQFAVLQHGPAGMVVEMPGHQGNVEIPRLPDRLPVVHRLQDGEEPRVLLYPPGQGVEVASPSWTPQGPPTGLGPASGGGRRVKSVRGVGYIFLLPED